VLLTEEQQDSQHLEHRQTARVLALTLLTACCAEVSD